MLVDVLETSFKNQLSQPIVVDEGRYEVDLSPREMYAVYWKEPKCQIVRATWLYEVKGKDHNILVPFDEDIGQHLEAAWVNVLVQHTSPTSSIQVYDHVSIVTSAPVARLFDARK